MPEICLRYAQDMSKKCLWYADATTMIHLRYAQYMPEICPRYAEHMPMICPWYAHDIPLIYPWYTLDIPLIYPWCTLDIPLMYPWYTLDIAWWYAQDLTKSQKRNLPSLKHGAFLREAENLSNFRVILEEGLQFLRFFPSMCAIRICGWWKHFWSPWAQHRNCNQDWTKAV